MEVKYGSEGGQKQTERIFFTFQKPVLVGVNWQRLNTFAPDRLTKLSEVSQLGCTLLDSPVGVDRVPAETCPVLAAAG